MNKDTTLFLPLVKLQIYAMMIYDYNCRFVYLGICFMHVKASALLEYKSEFI
jgi:hypothetical protein